MRPLRAYDILASQRGNRPSFLRQDMCVSISADRAVDDTNVINSSVD